MYIYKRIPNRRKSGNSDIILCRRTKSKGTCTFGMLTVDYVCRVDRRNVDKFSAIGGRRKSYDTCTLVLEVCLHTVPFPCVRVSFEY